MTTKTPITPERRTQLVLWVKQLRESKTFGNGSCSTVDEAMSDSELMEALSDFDTWDEAWSMLCDIEETHWDMCGIEWKRPDGVV